MELSPAVSTTALLGLLMLCSALTMSSTVFESALPGIPKLKGYPLVGAIPIYFRDGMSLMLETLTKIGEDGISYARVGNKTLVSVHDPVMVKEVLNIPDGVASRSVFTLQTHSVQRKLTTIDWETPEFSVGHHSGR